jgi:uncharacterized protein YfaT (DUF1175 family)
MMSRHEALNEKTVATVRFDICAIEQEALQQWLRACWSTDNVGAVVWYAMCYALTNPEHYARWLRSVGAYARAEGMEQADLLRSRLAARYKTRNRKTKNQKKA